jgi:diacylglycerol kinase (ATP)
MSYPEKHIALLCNPGPHNEKALRITDDIALLLTGMGIGHSIFTSYWPKVWEGISDAWIIGGDGTLNHFINQYPEFDLPISLFAGGSGNDFHWMLYGEKNLEDQVDFVLEGQAQPVDAGICNGRLFLNGVGIGFDGAIVRDMLGKKKLAGKASYLFSILKNIAVYHEKACTIQLLSEKISQDCFMISVANAKRYGGSFLVAPKAILSDGLLDVNIIGRINPFSRLRYLPVIEKGEHLALSFIQYRQDSRVSISSSSSLHAHIDGEYISAEMFEISLLPKRFSFIY